MSQSSHESSEAYLVLSLWKEGIDDPVPQWVNGKFCNLLEIFPTESLILPFVQAGELAVQERDLTMGKPVPFLISLSSSSGNNVEAQDPITVAGAPPGAAV